jgi:hypothetical protein
MQLTEKSMKESAWVVYAKVDHLLFHPIYTAWCVDGGNWWEWGRHAEGDSC